MASTLCCTAEQAGRPDSPQLPNARVSQATPAKQPLLPRLHGSPGSRFTSAASEDMHELRDIFHGADDHRVGTRTPIRAPRPRFSRPSIHSLHSPHSLPSLHSLRTMASLRSVIKRKFSKDWPKKGPAASPIHATKTSTKTSTKTNTKTNIKTKELMQPPDTVIKQSKQGPPRHLHITKDDLRRDLLSDGHPDDGGYDSDAVVLDDIARNMGKKNSGNRPSIHSIDWTPSTSSKPTPASSTGALHSAGLHHDLQPYNLEQTPVASFATRISQVFSTPNLRLDTCGHRDAQLRRSHSATSMGLPKPSPISPLRLPSLSTYDSNGLAWSEVLNESLRLSQFPLPPHDITLQGSDTTVAMIQSNRRGGKQNVQQDSLAACLTQSSDANPSCSARAIEIRVQQPTSSASPRPSTSVKGGSRDAIAPTLLRQNPDESNGDDVEEENPRRSVHLYSMRISHHLRSGSLLSWDQLADAPDLPTPPRPIHERSVSDQSRQYRLPKQNGRHGRQTSSSGFASSKVPSRWGKVLTHDNDFAPDLASSIYSSRPQSPPDSYGGSMVSLTRADTSRHVLSIASVDAKKPRRSQSYPSVKNPTPKLLQRDETALAAPTDPADENAFPKITRSLARKNSVAETKTSKFREDFSPSPPKRRLAPSASIIKFLNPKRLSMRSQSEANFHHGPSGPTVDGHFDTLPIPNDRERRQSRSLISMHAEQHALGHDIAANHVWDRALQAHQEEKASLFLSKNKDQALRASPFRERSGSIAARRPSFTADSDSMTRAADSARRASHVSTSMLDPIFVSKRNCAPTQSRRSALAAQHDVQEGHTVSLEYEKQGDSAEIVGAWGRYPSHTRHDRTFSAGKVDRVDTRDFALEAAVKFASNVIESHDDDLIDPIERPSSPPLLPGQKRREKRVGSGRMATSHPMTFSKTLMKNYSKMFKSQSTEFRRHGRGHRSSITSGGILEFPELELLPDVWTGQEGSFEVVSHTLNQWDSNAKQEAARSTGDSMATLRPRRNSSAPNLDKFSFHGSTIDDKQGRGQARVYSVYYEDCLSSFPRLSTDTDMNPSGPTGQTRLSVDSRRASVCSPNMPAQSLGHLRTASQASRRSATSHGSTRPSNAFLTQDGAAEDEKSIQEVMEHAALTGEHRLELEGSL
ncbi:hypothetical protein ACN47E_006009 [Coniothyrium glycines]